MRGCSRTRGGRRGLALPIAIVGGSFLAVVMVALSIYSSAELELARAVVNQVRSEYAAYGGLMWADAKLRISRWYQEPGNALQHAEEGRKVAHKTCFYGPGPCDDPELEVSVYLDEIKSKNKIDINRTLPDGRTQKGRVAQLDHIRVLAMATAKKGRESCLLFGKFIMAPEPLYDSDSTTGALEENAATETQELVIHPAPYTSDSQPPDMSKVLIMSKETHPYALSMKEWTYPNWPAWPKVGMKVTKGQPVLIYGIEMSGGWGLSTQRVIVKSPFNGTITAVPIQPDQYYPYGTVVLKIQREPSPPEANVTLKKLVRITRVPLSIYQGLDLTKIADRFKVYEYVNAETTDYVCNFAALRDLRSPIENAFGPVTDLTMDEGRVLSLLGQGGTLSPPDKESAGRRFMEDMLDGFYPPGRLGSGSREKFRESARYELGVQKSDPDPFLVSLLKLVGPIHGRDYIGELEGATARANPSLYNVASTAKYLEAIRKFGVGGEDFIKARTFLKNAAVSARVQMIDMFPRADSMYKDEVAAGILNPDEWFWWQEKAGWYKKPKPEDVKVEKIDVPYTFVSDVKVTGNDGQQVPFRMRTDYLLNYFRKHYDDGTVAPPSSELVPEDDVWDVPQLPGPPDTCGAVHSGISS